MLIQVNIIYCLCLCQNICNIEKKHILLVLSNLFNELQNQKKIFKDIHQKFIQIKSQNDSKTIESLKKYDLLYSLLY